MTCSVLDKKLDVGDDVRTFLDFIKEHQRLSAVQLTLGKSRQLHKNIFFILNVLEYPLGAFILQKVDLYEILIMRLGKMLDDKSLADLSCAIDKQGISTTVRVELFKLLSYLAFYHLLCLFEDNYTQTIVIFQ